EASETADDRVAIDQLTLVARRGIRLGRASEETTFDRLSPVVVLHQVHDCPAEVCVEGAEVSQMSETADHADEGVLRDVLRECPVPGEEVREPDRRGAGASVK